MTQNRSPLDQRKWFARFARQLEAGTPPNQAQTIWLINTLKALSDSSADTEIVLGIKYGPGQGLAKEEAACKMDFIMHWIAGAIASDSLSEVPPMGIEEAIDRAAVIAKQLFQDDTKSDSYDREYIKKCWHDKAKKHRQNPNRDADSVNTYYDF